MGVCRRCGRELKDPNAQYGWRCAEILGVQTGAAVPEVPEKWHSHGYRAVYADGYGALDRMRIDEHAILQSLYFDSLADLYLAEYQGDQNRWEKAFWNIVTAMYPAYDEDGKLIPIPV